VKTQELKQSVLEYKTISFSGIRTLLNI